MAATSQPLATQIALDILKAGGTAVDAAIAANAALGLMEPINCGIGGDLYAIVWDAETQSLHGLNGSGRSPQSLTLQYFRDHKITELPYLGPLTVSVPGAVDSWFELHGRFGKLPMSEILAPATKYAREGFPVSEVIAWGWALGIESRKDFSGFADVFIPGGKAPVKGQMFRNPGLAKAYELIAAEGRDAFYKGDIAKALDAYMAENGGFLTLEDLAAHKSDWVEPVATSYRGYELHELPPNGQGIAALQMLNILEQFDIKSMGYGSADYIHTLVEAKKVVYEDRARYYADLDFYNAPIERLVSKEYGIERAALIDPNKAAATYAPGDMKIEHGDTIYLTVADKDGNMVSLIQSNYGEFGAGLTLAEYGFGIQNRGALFSLEDGHANVYEPGKRPFHTIIPAFITKDDKPLMSFGVMGGAMQPQGHVQIMINMIDFGMNLQEAGDAARVRHFGSSQPTDQKMTDGGELFLETAIGKDVREQLTEMGHTLTDEPQSVGGYQGILYDADNGVYYGATESRKDGQAAGY
jgi:gamma-glutamyltranspeptidase/glutathione hydrolase